MNKMIFTSITAALVMVSALYAQEEESKADSITVERFIELASFSVNNNTSNEGCLLEAKVTAVPGVVTRVFLIKSEANPASLLILDGRDNTPVLMAKGKQVMLYEPISSKILLQDNVGVSFHFKLIGEKFVFGMGVRSEPSDLIDIDFGSFLQNLSPNAQISPEGNKIHWFEGRSEKGNICRAQINIASPTPLARFELNQGTSPSPLIQFTRIEGNPTFSDAFYNPPETNLKDGGLIHENGMNAEDMAQAYIKMCAFRAAILSPEFRKSNPALASLLVNWEQLKEKDAKASASLRQAFATELKALGMEAKPNN